MRSSPRLQAVIAPTACDCRWGARLADDAYCAPWCNLYRTARTLSARLAHRHPVLVLNAKAGISCWPRWRRLRLYVTERGVSADLRTLIEDRLALVTHVGAVVAAEGQAPAILRASKRSGSR